jgi:4-hydroxy-3-methylbut-2-enyl diphosphate reductase
VVENLQRRGAVFVERLDVIPSGSVTVFSAHGVSTAVVEQAKRLCLQIIDATCPLVTKVHMQAQRYSHKGYAVVIIGHAGHEEVEGTQGSIEGPVHIVTTIEDVEALPATRGQRIAYVTQTTLSIDDTRAVIAALKERFPSIQGPELDDICYATQNRQNAVRALAREVDVLLVVGARNSSNSNRLREVGEQCGVPSYLVQDDTEIDAEWFIGKSLIGITAGASAPEVLVERVLAKLRPLGVTSVRELDGVRETTAFRLPRSLTAMRSESRASSNARG